MKSRVSGQCLYTINYNFEIWDTVIKLWKKRKS